MNKKNQKLTRPQIQRFLLLCQLNDTYTHPLFKNVMKDMIERKFVEFEEEKLTITEKGKKEVERLIRLSGNQEDQMYGKRISAPISS